MKMVKVKMKTLSAGPDGVHHPNKPRFVTEKEGEDLVAGGYAEYLRHEKPHTNIAEIDLTTESGKELYIDLVSGKEKNNDETGDGDISESSGESGNSEQANCDAPEPSGESDTTEPKKRGRRPKK